MSIQSSVSDIRVRGTFGTPGAIVVQMPPESLRVKVVLLLLLNTMLLTFCAVAVARTGALPEIAAPPQSYLPGNALPQLPKDVGCDEHEAAYQSCVTHLGGQTIYLNYDPITRMIIHTAITAREHRIGDLIMAWGNPTGMSQHNTSVFIYWNTRSAVLYTDSFRPENPVEFIQYDLQEREAPAWEGFKRIKSGEKSDAVVGSS